MAALFILELIRRTVGEPPALISSLAVGLLLGQPYLTLRLAAQLRQVPRLVTLTALAAYLVTAAVLVVLGSSVPGPIVLAAIAVFALTELAAAAYLARGAARRVGSARVRLWLAALATAAFAAAILGAAAGGARGWAEIGGAAGGILALLAAVGYLLAFLPPGWLRRVWQATAARRFSEDLLAVPADAPTTALWQRFAGAAREIAGSDAAIMLRESPGGVVLEVAQAGIEPPIESQYATAEFEQLVRRSRPGVELSASATDGLVSGLAARSGANIYTVVPLAGPAAERAILILLSERRSLFAADDRAVIDALAAQTRFLAERRGMLADQERLTAELETTVEALKAASQAKSDFLASMSHELRTPLSAIIGFSDLMRDEPGDESVRIPREWIDHIRRSGNHLLELINDVLDLTKVEAGRLELRPERLDLRSAIGESIAGLRPLAERKQLQLSSDVEPATIVADRGRFRQILYNLLSNAIKFTSDGGRVDVVARSGSGSTTIAVIDTGVGIAPEDQTIVFEEFRQVGDRGSHEAGTGLGLALTRRLVEAHGGSIDVESALGQGSRFTIVLPLVDSPEAALPGPTGAAARRPPLASRRRPNILVIEDDPTAIQLLRAYLEADDYDVRVALSGEAGLLDAREAPPSAIILDVVLPGIDGWEVLRQLKRNDALRDVPVLIVTVLDERDVGLALGAVDYFVKPIDREALLDRLARYTFTTKVKERAVRVLAVDDDPGALDFIDVTLREEGFGVLKANGGREALEVARTEPIDLVICDLLMPDFDGFALVAALKDDMRTRDTPILVLTAHEMTDAEKVRLNGNILGVVGKGADAKAGLRDWLLHAVPVGAGDAGPLSRGSG